MPDEPLPPPPPPPPEPPGLPPPLPEGLAPTPPSRGFKAFAKFSGGCLLAILGGFLLGITIFQDTRHEAMGCAAAQLLYIIPAVVLLLKKHKPAWAYGLILGACVVLLMASLCGNMDFK